MVVLHITGISFICQWDQHYGMHPYLDTKACNYGLSEDYLHPIRFSD